VTLLVIMDPLGNAPIFVILTKGRTPQDARRIAVRVVVAAAVLVIGFALFGEVVLRYLRVSIDSVSIAGGLLLLLVALEMLRGSDMNAVDDESELLVPLATPLLAGPGAIATVIVLGRQHPGVAGRASVLAGIVVALIAVGVTFALAERVARVLRPSVLQFFTRVVGLLLAAIAVQLVTDGVIAIVDAHRS
jgi:multiple antibiotic resistance protein